MKTQYNVLEGETVDIVFKRNAKGKSHFPLLTIQGSIASEGDDNGRLQNITCTVFRKLMFYFRLPASLSEYSSAGLRSNVQFDYIQGYS